MLCRLTQRLCQRQFKGDLCDPNSQGYCQPFHPNTPFDHTILVNTFAINNLVPFKTWWAFFTFVAQVVLRCATRRCIFSLG